jgi:hypothetical protein
MTVEAHFTDKGIECPCGRKGLHTFVSVLGVLRLSSHAPVDPTFADGLWGFCIHSHDDVQEAADGIVLVQHGRVHTDVDPDAFQLGGRADEEIIPSDEVKPGNVPEHVLGIKLSKEDNSEQ